MKKSLLLLPLLASCGVARADLSYTQTTSSPFSAAAGVTSKVYSKGDSNRTEAQAFGRKMITISSGAKRVIQIDPATKTYTVSNGGSAAVAKSMMPMGSKTPPINMTVAARKVGVETVRGIKSPHYRIDMNMQANTPRGPQTVKVGMDVWGSNVAVPTSAKTRADALQNLPDTFRTMFGSSAKVKGNLKGMGAAFATVPLRMKMTMNGQTLATTETSAISTKPLPASLFAVPARYRAVSNAQFNATQQAALRKSMAALMKGMQGR